ncbi:MAG: phospholipase A [Sulfuricurvum sp.]
MKKCISLSLALVSFLGMGSLSPVWSDDDTVSAQEFAAVEQEAHKGLKASMYQLGYLYQNGLGTEVNYEKAAYWFKQAASEYRYAVEGDNNLTKSQKTLVERLEDQMDPSTNKEGNAFLLHKMDTKTPETKKLMGAHFNGDFFGLRPYETNFLLPVGYSTHKYPRIDPGIYYGNYSLAQQQEGGHYDKNMEVQFQFSLTKMLTYNLFGWNESLNAAYTQRVWWQLYSPSGPFRETNYLPEVFMSLPTSEYIDDHIGLKMVKFGFIHESNGQEGYRSRSWNRLYLSGAWQFNNFFMATRAWYRLPEQRKYEGYYTGAVNPATGVYQPNASGDDNPLIQHYLGYGDVRLKYLYGDHEVGALLRYNFGSGGMPRGAVDLHWSYPYFNSKNTFLYLKLFSGYGESLIDYDRSVTKIVGGFSFSRDVF